MAQDITIMGASYSDVPAVTLPKTGGGTAQFTDVADTTATASDVASGKQFFDALGVLTQGTASGGGGASNIVTGTFKGTTTGAPMDINLNYSGSGYPIAVLIYPSEGTYNQNGDYFVLNQSKIIGICCAIKCIPIVIPEYSKITTDNKDYASVYVRYKSSSYSSSNSFSNKAIYNQDDAVSSSSNCIAIKSAKKMSVYIASTSYGFAANIEYTYWVIYSS